MRIIQYIFLLLAGLSFFACEQEWSEIAVNSPDYKLQLVFYLKDGKPLYKLSYADKQVLKESSLGFKLLNLPSLDSNFILLDKNLSSYNEVWEQPWGEEKRIANKYNQLTIFLQEREGMQRRMNIIFRMFNKGLAFRYEFPEQENLDEFQIAEEKTSFSLFPDDSAWWIPAYKPERYEYIYKKSVLSDIDTAHTPLTVEAANGLVLCFHEAALYDFPSYTLYPSDSSGLIIDLVPWKNGVKAYVETPFATPWRTIQIAKTPAELVTNYMILNLNDSCRIEDISWIKPAKYVGIWWGMHIGRYTWGSGPKHGATTANTKRYIDFAAENSFGGVLVEGWNQGWDGDWMANGAIFSFTKAHRDFNLKVITDYAREKGVSLIGHHETSAHIDNYEDQMEEAYKMYEDLGVKYIKTGYVGQNLFNGEWHHGQYAVRHYQKTVELAAEHHIMLCIHEPIKDCGIRRTWPNLMTREGARGMEWDAWGPDGGNPPSHVPTLVFTRLMSGPLDFTPGIFDIEIPQKPANRVNTTLAKQLAYYVVIYSPLQMAADLPEHYKGNPAFEFIRDVPCDWAKTKALNGKIGDYVTIIRKDRNSEDWYLGSITDEQPRDFRFILDFLEKGTDYTAEIYADGDSADWKSNPLPVDITRRTVTSRDTLFVHLAPGGGQAVRFTPLTE